MTPVYYVLKEGARPFVYDIESKTGAEVNDTTQLANVYSSDDSDMDNAANLKANAAAEALVLGKSRAIKSSQMDALKAINAALTGAKDEATGCDESESDGEVAA